MADFSEKTLKHTHFGEDVSEIPLDGGDFVYVLCF